MIHTENLPSGKEAGGWEDGDRVGRVVRRRLDMEALLQSSFPRPKKKNLATDHTILARKCKSITILSCYHNIVVLVI